MNTILLVDDGSGSLAGVARHLEAGGFRVTQTASSAEAIERLGVESFDVVVSRLSAAAPEGHELLRRAKDGRSDPPVVILSRCEDIDSWVEALRLGADDFVDSVSDPSELLCRIKGGLERRSLRRLELERQESTIEALSRSLEKKERLLGELQHRVKNSLAMISGLISLEGSSTGNKSVREVIISLRKRVRAIDLVYEQLSGDEEPTQIDFRIYVESLTKALSRLLAVSPADVLVAIEMEHLEIALDTAIPFGLVVEELLSNSLAHAFPARRRGSVVVRLTKSDGDFLLTVADDGIGLPAGPPLEARETLGFRLVGLLAGQLGGQILLGEGLGTSVSLRVPIKREG